MSQGAFHPFRDKTKVLTTLGVMSQFIHCYFKSKTQLIYDASFLLLEDSAGE